MAKNFFDQFDEPKGNFFDQFDEDVPSQAEVRRVDNQIEADADAAPQEVVTSARAWRGAGAGRGSFDDPRRLDVNDGMAKLEREKGIDRLAEELRRDNKHLDEKSLRNFAAFRYDNMVEGEPYAGKEADRASRKETLIKQGYDDKNADAKVEFDMEFNERQAKKDALDPYGRKVQIGEGDTQQSSEAYMKDARDDYIARKVADENPISSSLASGLGMAGLGIANAPQAAVNAVIEAGDALQGLATGEKGNAQKLPKWWFTEEAAKVFQQAIPSVANKGVAESWRDGDFGLMMMSNMAASSPSAALSLASMFVPALRAAILPTMGAMSAGANYSTGDSAIGSAAKGAIEMGTEMLPLKGFDKMNEVLAKMPVPLQKQAFQIAGQKLLKAGTAITVTGLTNAVEEAAAQVGGNIVDKVIEGKDVGLMDDVAKAALIGGATGKVLGIPSAAMQLVDPLTPEQQIAKSIEQAAAAAQISPESVDSEVRASLSPDRGIDPRLTAMSLRKPEIPDIGNATNVDEATATFTAVTSAGAVDTEQLLQEAGLDGATDRVAPNAGEGNLDGSDNAPASVATVGGGSAAVVDTGDSTRPLGAVDQSAVGVPATTLSSPIIGVNPIQTAADQSLMSRLPIEQEVVQNEVQPAAIPDSAAPQSAIPQSNPVATTPADTVATPPGVSTTPPEEFLGPNGNGYQTEKSAETKRIWAAKSSPNLDWKIEPLENGGYRVAGYTIGGTNVTTPLPNNPSVGLEGEGAGTSQVAPVTGGLSSLGYPAGGGNVSPVQSVVGDAAAARAKTQAHLDRLNTEDPEANPKIILGEPSEQEAAQISEALEQAKVLFGVKANVVAFNDPNPESVNGIQIGDTVYINTHGLTSNALNTGWHETHHVMQTIAEQDDRAGRVNTPAQKYRDKVDDIFDTMSEAGKRSYIENFLYKNELAKVPLSRREAVIQRLLVAPKLRREMMADFVGNRATDKKFIRSMAQADPKGFKAWAEKWMSIVNGLLDSLRGNGKNKESANVDKYVADLNKSRTIVKEALLELRSQGLLDNSTQQDAPQFQRREYESVNEINELGNFNIDADYANSLKDDFNFQEPDDRYAEMSPEERLRQELQDAQSFQRELAEELAAEGFGVAGSAKLATAKERSFADVKPSDIKSAGLMAEDAYPPIKYYDSPTGIEKTGYFVVNGQRYRATIGVKMGPDIDPNALSKNKSGSTRGMPLRYQLGSLSDKAREDWNKRFAASADLFRRRFDLYTSIPAKARENVLQTWKAIAENPDAFEFLRATDPKGSNYRAVAQDIASKMLRDSRYEMTITDKNDDYVKGSGTFGFSLYDSKTGTTSLGDIEFHPKEKEVTVHVQDLEKGSSAGKPVYQVAQAFASAFKAKIEADPQGLLGVNNYRRTEQMFSGALRSGDSDTMQPGVGQRIYGWNERAKTQEQKDRNLVRIALASARNAKEFVPSIDSVSYDLATGEFSFKDGGRSAEEWVKTMLGNSDVRTASISRSTLARAAITFDAIDGNIINADDIAEPVLYQKRQATEDGYDYEKALEAKWPRIRRFQADHARLVQRFAEDAEKGIEEASIMRLIAHTGFRIGGSGMSAGVPTYGAASLKPEHVKVKGDTITFNFRGKSGVQQVHSFIDKALARDMKKRLASGRETIFGKADRAVRRYHDSVIGDADYKVHDYRTMVATNAAKRIVESLPQPKSAKELKAFINLAADEAARKIGDDRATALKSYVDPIIFDGWKRSLGIEQGDTARDGKGANGVSQAGDDGANGRATRSSVQDGEVSLSRKQVDTPEFKRWFGDSKVIDADGTPRVMYHGTGKSFTKPRTVVLDDGLELAIGFYVSPNPEFANTYAGEKTGANVMPLYVKAVKPFDYENQEHLESLPIAQFKMILAAEGKSRSSINDMIDAVKLGSWPVIEQMNNYGLFNGNGFDGFYVKEDGVKNLAVFKPSQLKSATGNRGTFSDASDDIRYSKKQTETPEFKRWFGYSKVVDADGKPMVVYHGTAVKRLIKQFKGKGISGWFAENKDAADSYAITRAEERYENSGRNMSEEEIFANNKTYSVFLSIKNPLDLSAFDMNQKVVGDGSFATSEPYKGLAKKDKNAWTKAFGSLPVSKRFAVARQIAYKAVADFGIQMGEMKTPSGSGYSPISLYEIFNSPEFARDAKAAGYDGILILEGGERTWAAFDPEQIKSAEDNNGEFDPENPDIRYSRRQSGLPEETKFQKARRKLQDSFIHVKEIQDFLTARGGVVGEAQDVYRAEERMHGRTQELLNDFANKQLKPLTQKAVEYGIDLDELSLYAYAKHAEERNRHIASINRKIGDAGSGMDDATAQNIMQMVELEGNKDKFDELHQMLMGITSTTRRVMLDEGLITQDEYDAWESQYENYIPLRGFENVDPEGNPKPGLGRGFTIKGKETIRAMGRNSRAGDLIENVIRDYERAVIRSEKNQVAKVFLDLALSNPDPDLWEITPVKLKRKIGPTGLVSHSQVNDTSSPDVLTLKVQGHEVHIKIKDELLLRAMKAVYKEEMSDLEMLLVNTLGTYTNLLRNTLTRYNPVFGGINAIRDSQMGAVSVFDELGWEGLKLYNKYYGSALAASFRKEANIEGTGEMDKWLQEMRFAGGTTGGFQTRDLKEISSDLRTMMLQAGAAPKTKTEWIKSKAGYKGFQNTLKALEIIGSTSEDAARVAAYRAARELGKTPAQAASIAKNLTTNFNRKGEWGAALNSAYLFFNAGVQGSTRVLQALKKPRSRYLLAGLSGLSMGLALMAAGMGDDEDGEAYWDKIPDYEKERNLIIMLPPGADMEGVEKVGTNGRYIKLPAPYGVNIFMVLGYQLADLARNMKDPVRGVKPMKAAINLTSAIFGSMNPFGGAFDPSSVVNWALAAAPTAIDLPIQIGGEVDSFGRPVAPERSKFDQKPDSERYSPRQAGGAAQRVAEWMNSVSGGNSAREGWLDFAPGTLENIVRSTTGGLGTFVYDTFINLPTKFYSRADGHPVEITDRDIPFWRNLYGEVDGQTDLQKFYERSRKARKEYETANNEGDDGIEREYSNEELAMIELGGLAESYSKAMSAMRKEELEIADSEMSAGAKMVKRQGLNKERQQIAKEFNEQWVEKMRELAEE